MSIIVSLARRMAAWRGLLLVLALGLAACDSVEDRVARHHARGLELLQKNDPKRAWLEFRNAVRLDENHAPSRFEIAKLYEADGELRAAMGNYRLVAELDPAHLQARLRLAQILMIGGGLDEAQTYADQALALAPLDPDAIAVKAAVLFRQDAGAEAAAEAERAIAIAPHHVGANLVLISQTMAGGDLGGALARLDALIAAHPDDRNLHIVRLQVLERMGDDAGIGAQLQTMTERFPDEIALRRAYVQWLLRAGRQEEAEAQLRALADATPEDPAPVIDLVRLLAAREGVEAARAELAARTAAAPDAARGAFVRTRADFEVSAGQPEAARAILREFIAQTEPSDADGAAARTRLADLLLGEGNEAEALALADAVLAADETNVGATMVRARVMIDRYDAAEAAVLLRRVLDQDPQNVRLMTLMALAYERSGSPDLAAERLAAALRASGYAPDTALRYAAFLRGRNQPGAAETVLAEAARIHPRDRTLLAALAEAQLRRGDHDAASRTIAELRSADPGDELATRIEAASLGAQGRLNESIGILERLAEKDTVSTDIAALVAAYVRSGETERAEALLDEVMARDPDNPVLRVLRAELHLFRGDLAAAERLLQDTVEQQPAEAVGYIALTRLYMALGRSDEAVEIARRGTASATQPAPVRLLLAQMLEARQAFDEAIAEYRALYELNRESILFANNLASLIADHQSADAEALAFAERITRRLRGSTVPEIQDTYGWIRFLQGDHADALRSLIPAAAALPNNPLVQYHAGRAYAAVGQVAEARQHLEQAMAIGLDPAKADSARAALAALPPAN